MYPKIASLLIIAAIALLSCSSIVIASAADTSKPHLSGYVLDSNGCGITGAEIRLILSTPFAPYNFTDDSGYFEFEGWGTGSIYRVLIYPPNGTNFVDYRIDSYVVQPNTTNNFTLTRGYVLTGYVMDQNGKPVYGKVCLDQHYSGEWSNSSNGYFSVTAPPGTYTVHVFGGRSRWDSASYEYFLFNPTITLNSDASKNIIVLNTQDTPCNRALNV